MNWIEVFYLMPKWNQKVRNYAHFIKKNISLLFVNKNLVKIMDFYQSYFYQIPSRTKISESNQIHALSQYPDGDFLTHHGKCKILKNFLGWDLAVVFPMRRYQGNQSGMIWEFSELNWHMQGWTNNIEVVE